MFRKLSGKIRIVYDVDDTLNNLNDYVHEKLGIKTRADRFTIRECKVYSVEQQDAILEAYGDPETFKNLSYVPGATDIFDIEELGNIEVYILSRNFNSDIADIKTESILREIPGATVERIEMQIGNGEGKRIDELADIIVEDCLDNCLKYDKEVIKIIIDKPHNKLETYGLSQEDCPNLIRVKSLLAANQVIRDLLELEV